MKQARIILIIFLTTFYSLIFTHCDKDKQTNIPISIILRNKPLSVIQSYINGKWELEYIYGGFITSKYIDTINSYVIFSPDHIVYGDDLRAIFIDTTLIWERVKILNDSVYLFTYPHTGNSPPMHQIIDQIKDDTLIIVDYAADAFSYFYTKD